MCAEDAEADACIGFSCLSEYATESQEGVGLCLSIAVCSVPAIDDEHFALFDVRCKKGGKVSMFIIYSYQLCCL